MTVANTVVLECRTTGADTNGGGFVPGSSGTDWSQQTSPQYSVTDGVTNASTTITSATAAFGTDVVGNLIFVSGGTGSITGNWYQIISRTNATTIVVDRSTGLTTGTGATLKIGGALLSPAIAAGIINSAGGGVCFIKYTAGTPYTISTNTQNVAGGQINITTNFCAFVGYDTTRSLFAPGQNRPTLQIAASLSSCTIINGQNVQTDLQSMILDANSQTSSSCINCTGTYFNVWVKNFDTFGFTANTSSQQVAIYCESSNGIGSGCTPMSVGEAFLCTSHDHPSAGFFAFGIAANWYYGCIVYNCNQAGFGYGTPNVSGIAINCIAYNCGTYGFFLNNSGGINLAINCISQGNGNLGYQINSGRGGLINCADFNNTSGRKGGGGTWVKDLNPITGTGSFFNSAGTDFGLNNTAGAGAAVRAAGFPSQPGSVGFSPGLPSTIAFGDLGPIQHQDTGGSSGPIAQLKLFARGTPY